ncbi:MAG: hypothetical protein KC506_03670, partial [Nanoarchaeota archaeon]|nr:hypothetical protein [Nanoarchaeota archaeon]
PERIQKETLIKGYTKYKIPKSIFDNFEKDFGVEEKRQRYKDAREREEYSLATKLEKDFRKAQNESSDLKYSVIKGICMTLSNGKFPLETYNHRIQADDSSSEGADELVKEKIILGEISSISGDFFTLKYRDSGTISAIIDTDGKIVRAGDFMHRKDGSYSFGEFTGARSDYPERNNIRLRRHHGSKMSEDEFNVLTKDRIMISTMSGLYLLHGKVWGDQLATQSFGFDVNEPYLKKYLNKVKEIYTKLPEDIISEKNSISLDGLLKNEAKIPVVDIILPIMTGNTGLPALRWGHAKYAVVPTEKNFNFLIMDYLPAKEEIDSLDS